MTWSSAGRFCAKFDVDSMSGICRQHASDIHLVGVEAGRQLLFTAGMLRHVNPGQANGER